MEKTLQWLVHIATDTTKHIKASDGSESGPTQVMILGRKQAHCLMRQQLANMISGLVLAMGMNLCIDFSSLVCIGGLGNLSLEEWYYAEASVCTLVNGSQKVIKTCGCCKLMPETWEQMLRNESNLEEDSRLARIHSKGVSLNDLLRVLRRRCRGTSPSTKMKINALAATVYHVCTMRNKVMFEDGKLDLEATCRQTDPNCCA